MDSQPAENTSFSEDTKGNYGLFGNDRLTKRPLMRVAAELMECYDEKRAVAQLEATSRVAKATDREEVAKRSAQLQVEKACALSAATMEKAHLDKAAQRALMNSRYSTAGAKCQQEVKVSQALTEADQKDAQARKEAAEAWLRNAQAEAEAAVQKALARKEDAVRRAEATAADAVRQGAQMVARATAIAEKAQIRSKAREEQEMKRCQQRLQTAKDEISRRRGMREQGTQQVLSQTSEREELVEGLKMFGQKLQSGDTAATGGRLVAESNATSRYHMVEQQRIKGILDRSRTIALDLGRVLDKLRAENFAPEELQALETAMAAVQEPAVAETLGVSVTGWRDQWRITGNALPSD